MFKLAPSLLSADFSDLKNEIKKAEEGGADLFHLDIMDGHFVPNLTFGPMIVKAIRKLTSLPLDSHLMISNPDQYIDEFRNAGSDIITVHYEACQHLHRTIMKIKQTGAKAGVAINPATPVYAVEEIIDYVDLLLIMSVNPGFGGQKFIETSLRKVVQAKKIITERNLNVEIEVDGGIDINNVELLLEAGADIIVAGSSVFKSNDVTETVKKFKKKFLEYEFKNKTKFA
ncbi:ribulose-5-phosphate 3-epimerase [Candidatus Kryptonium thompsonii]|uniref:Ribulose-phosphate 3-epimerase n=1 Tax=Candidatus Kryptonium thompsonii TaxID=1633631 RepID=A0A0P1M2A2_9BACT|nr:ribulose-phosphate 3-epimerase [Candidatus Kryptonium thompsoni]CUS76585.1 ribulose-5-phosphate 3-epimerase [Candidatus Kryptonium thompsoni]CUS82829.1 ribulose-5-phosphate 3-epimerase [Candidatus Kryptonium thompsoni]CUS86037.1 ribulose-5-phosphate 3-epimerase [Candidatus Kryptonium thompsoni]CUS88072.1 ribulose-5-phosphate 3-epimerase [Candidatus Kryptonium thompsoni]CUS88686.1 ribulose-5-phosphate 3-epimerase [Candidatus Kryptonium thompsoni]